MSGAKTKRANRLARTGLRGTEEGARFKHQQGTLAKPNYEHMKDNLKRDCTGKEMLTISQTVVFSYSSELDRLHAAGIHVVGSDRKGSHSARAPVNTTTKIVFF